MNVIFVALRAQLELSQNKLHDIEFDELIMRTTDHRNTFLKFWIELIIVVERIFRLIRCFEFSQTFISESAMSKHHSLLLKLSWIFSVNAIIFIRDSKITIDDSTQEEIAKDIIESKMMFCTKHTLIMYSKKALIKTANVIEQSDNDSESSKNTNSSDDESSRNDLYDIENERHFEKILSMI